MFYLYLIKWSKHNPYKSEIEKLKDKKKMKKNYVAIIYGAPFQLRL